MIATGGAELGTVRALRHLSVRYTEQAQMASSSHITTKQHNLALNLQSTEFWWHLGHTLLDVRSFYMKKETKIQQS